MKRVLFLFLENGPAAVRALENIRSSGFNGTLVGGASLRHALDGGKLPEEHAFFHLAHWEIEDKKESTVSMFIVDEDHLELLKNTIRDYTDHFKSVKGGFYSLPLDDYEGTF